MNKILRISLVVIGSLLALALIIFAAVYFWPTRSSALQTASMHPMSYDNAIAKVASINQEESTRSILPECTSTLMTHGTKTAKAVVMLHGVTACPSQFKPLAQKFFDAGYNVYIPRAPHHGTADQREHGKVVASELVSYVNQSFDIADGLGEEVGVAGLSGGGVLATWATEYRTDVKRLLVLSPFYETAANQVPKWQLPLLKKLYGYHILGDQFTTPATPQDASFSYYALSNYLIMTDNLKPDPTNLPVKSVAVVTSASDDVIDLDLAVRTPTNLADANRLPIYPVLIPADWKAGHAIVSPDTPGVAAHQTALFQLYFDLYEGRDAKL